MRHIKFLYHLAEKANYPSIVEHGLMSASQLLRHAGVPGLKSRAILRGHRQDNLQISKAAMIRDQKPMPPSALAPVLGRGLKPEDWYEFLNGFVFLWTDEERLMRHLKACQNRPQVLLTFSAAAIVKDFGKDAFVSPINSGNARRKPAFRDRDTFVPYELWLRKGWPRGGRSRPPAEFVLRCKLPITAPYLIGVKHL